MNHLIINHHKVNCIGILSIVWLDHIIRMDNQSVKKAVGMEPMESKTGGRLNVRCKDDLINDLKKMRVSSLNVTKVRESGRGFLKRPKHLHLKFDVLNDGLSGK